MYAGTEINDTGSMTFNGGAVVYGTIEDNGTFTINGTMTVESRGSLVVGALGTVTASTGLTLVDDGALAVSGTMTSPTGIQGNGRVIINGGNLSAGHGNPLQVQNASIAFTIENGGTLDASLPASNTDSFIFGPVNTIPNVLILPSYSGTVTASISGLGLGDQINLGTTATSAQFTANGDGSYSVAIGSITLSKVTLAPGETPSDFQVVNGVLSAVCFAKGTRIRTPRGDVAVETLRVGETVVTVSGESRPICWVGQRQVYPHRNPDPESVAPIRIRRGAIEAEVPARDLVVSPDHALFLDGVLIAARQLVNGVSVVQDCSIRTLRYFHVELDGHAVLLAENTAAESYLDTGNRDWFTNAGPVATLLARPMAADRQIAACVPFATDAATVEPIWRRLAERAAAQGFGDALATRATDNEPDLRILTGGRTIRPTSTNGRLRAHFVLPRGCNHIVLQSRAARPTELCPWLDDRRRLGVSVARILLRTGHDLREIPVDHPALGKGWWDVERSGTAMWRWTDGNGHLALGTQASAILDIHLDAVPAYPAAISDVAHPTDARRTMH